MNTTSTPTTMTTAATRFQTKPSTAARTESDW
jgi:hypothetical protein